MVAVMRRDRRKAEDYARRHGVPRFYDDASELIDDPEVNAVYIATPPSSHAMYAIQAARAGKPVYIEKPMAPTFSECEEVIAACRAAGVPVFVAYYRRALPRFLKVRELLEAKAIGELLTVNVRHFMVPAISGDSDMPWRLNPKIAGGGLFVDLASHTLDLLDFLLGPITSCDGFAANRMGAYPAEDTVVGSFEFASGVLGTGTWCFASPVPLESNEFVGTRGRILFSTFAPVPVVLEADGDRKEWDFSDPPHIQQPLIETLVNDLRQRTKSCPSTGVTAARTSRVMDTFLRSFRDRTN